MNRTRLVLLLVILSLVGSGFVAYKYFTGFQTLSINVSNAMENPSVTVYKVPPQNEVSNPELVINDKMIVKKITANSKLKLRKGRYYITATSKTTANDHQDITLEDKPTTVTINPYLNPTLLSQRVATEETSILPLLYKTYPQINHGYVLQTGKLYGQGDWYSATLISGSNPTPSDYHDVYHVVLHKKNGVWTVKTKFPDLNVDKYTYPDIPRDILGEVNKQGINL
jgi:hypothetical protein